MSIGSALLSDIQEAYVCKATDRLSSADIIKCLCADDEKRWATYNRGRPITPTQIAKLLREYSIYSNTIRIHGTTAKGYYLRQFEDALARYVVNEPATELPDISHATSTGAARRSCGVVSSELMPVTVAESISTRGGTIATLKSAQYVQAINDLLVTSQSPMGNTGVTYKGNTEDVCDVVTAPSSGGAVEMKTQKRMFPFSPVTALTAKEVMKAIVQTPEWSQLPDGIPPTGAHNHPEGS